MKEWDKENTNIKREASVIENRPDDKGCTMESVSEVNTQFLELAQKYPLDFVLINELKSSGRLLRQPSSDYSLAKIFGCTMHIGCTLYSQCAIENLIER